MQGDCSRVESRVFADDGTFPNSFLPVLIYRRALEGEVTSSRIEAMFAANNWPAQWVASIYDYHHYHSTAHEVLGVCAGSARVALGGPNGEVVDLAVGDVVVIPAGVAHKLESASDDFAVVGAYPPGQDWDVLVGEERERVIANDNLAHVPLPKSDPVCGASGPLVEVWH